MHTCMHTCMHTHAHTHIHTCMHTCVHAHMQVRQAEAAASAAVASASKDGRLAIESELTAALLAAAEARRTAALSEESATELRAELSALARKEADARLEASEARSARDVALQDLRSESTELHDLRRRGGTSEAAVTKLLCSELRHAEAYATREAKAADAATATAEREVAVMSGALEQANAVASSAKGVADERIRIVEREAQWHKAQLERDLAEVRGALEMATRNLLAEQSAVFSLRGMLLIADADVAAMRGATAHYAALGGEEAGALREALSIAEVRQREAVEAERRRSDASLTKERDHFAASLDRMRESANAVQAKLISQHEWLADALAEKTRELTAEREGFDAALAREREATAAAQEASRRVLQEVADRQAARHAVELSEQGAAMESQLALERDSYLTHLADRRELADQLSDARAEVRAAKLALSDARDAHAAERQALIEEAAAARTWGSGERAALVAAHEAELLAERARHEEAIAEQHAVHEDRVAQLAGAREIIAAECKGLEAALEREGALHASESHLWAERAQELEDRLRADRLHEARTSVSELETELASAQESEQRLKGRLRSLTAAAQAEVERGTTELAELNDARQRQMRLEHAQLAELHTQSGVALKELAAQRDAMRTEAEAHRRTQEQLVALHETMQAERAAYAKDSSGDRDARAQLPVVLAELEATRGLLEQMRREGTATTAAPGLLTGSGGGFGSGASPIHRLFSK